ncbi:UNKNOWN [Stylonychia lemnae]|uniref:Uncharacterized protein n=1 Tax=Stylonychia lemnae TaxID=5949 RepID=A0A078AQW4_STYLE|nr:UNKNOWN [Stylonychia lemnae]|eukprot:CDW83288.1 UNKNOWN [Stylonychia lemnae]
MRKILNYSILSLLYLSSTTFCEESYYKVRFYKRFIQDAFQKNLRNIFEQSQDFQVKDIYLKDLGTKMTSVQVQVFPKDYNYASSEVEVFFDEGQILLEMHDLYVGGSGLIVDPENGNIENVTFTAPIKTGQIFITPSETIRHSELYPKFMIDEVNIVIDEASIIATAHGKTPLFKTQKFEDAIKNWLHSETKSIKESIKNKLIDIENTLMDKIPYSFTNFGHTFIYSLADKIKLKEEYLEISFTSELEGVDHGEFSEKLRKIYPQFTDVEGWKQDIQMVFDENFLNHMFLSLFHTNTVFSFRDIAMKMIPAKYQNTALLISNLLMTTTLYPIVPDIVKEFEHGKLVDLRCGFSKSFLSDKIDSSDLSPSQVWFRDTNKIEFNSAFGCGVFVYIGKYNPFSPSKLVDKYWKNWRSFFFQGKGWADVSIYEGRFYDETRVKFLDGKLDINQFKIYKGEQEQVEEEESYKKWAAEQFDQLLSKEDDHDYRFMSHPSFLDCLGIKPESPKIEIKEGFIRASYALDVQSADQDCLLNKKTRLH